MSEDAAGVVRVVRMHGVLRCCAELERMELYRRRGEDGRAQVVYAMRCPVHGALGRRRSRTAAAAPMKRTGLPPGGIRAFKRGALPRRTAT